MNAHRIADERAPTRPDQPAPGKPTGGQPAPGYGAGYRAGSMDRSAGGDAPRIMARDGYRVGGYPHLTPNAAANGTAAAATERSAYLAGSAPVALMLIAGVWLIVSRLVFSFPADGSTFGGVANGVVVGLAVAVAALVRLASPATSPMLNGSELAFGGWMIAAPWVFGYAHWGSGPAWSDLLTGAAIAVAALAAWAAARMRSMADRQAAETGAGKPERGMAGRHDTPAGAAPIAA